MISQVVNRSKSMLQYYTAANGSGNEDTEDRAGCRGLSYRIESRARCFAESAIAQATPMGTPVEIPVTAEEVRSTVAAAPWRRLH